MAAIGVDQPDGSVTDWLQRFCAGEAGAGEIVLQMLYKELYRLARGYMRGERPGHLLQPTALVNEAYLHLVAQRDRNWRNRSHFLAMAAQTMHRILIDHARAQHASKRGGGSIHVTMDEHVGIIMHRPEDFLALDQALERLATFDAELAKLVELRYFGGLTEAEVAQLSNVSVRTVKRRWAVAKAWLYTELSNIARGNSA